MEEYGLKTERKSLLFVHTVLLYYLSSPTTSNLSYRQGQGKVRGI